MAQSAVATPAARKSRLEMSLSMAMPLAMGPLPVYGHADDLEQRLQRAVLPGAAVERQEDHLGVADHLQVAEAGHQEPALEGAELLDRGRSDPDRAAELPRLLRLGDVAARGVHHRHLVAALPQRGHDLHRGGQGDIALAARSTGQYGNLHNTSSSRVAVTSSPVPLSTMWRGGTPTARRSSPATRRTG